MNVLLIASLVLRESSRRRLVLTVAVVTLALVALTAWGFHALATMQDRQGHKVAHYDLLLAASTLENMMAFMFSFVLALGASFLGGLSTGNEIENGTLLAIVPRPIRRFEIIIGKWLGNMVLIAGYAAAIAACDFFVVWWMTGYLPPHPFAAVGFLVAESALLLTLTMALSIRLSALAAGFTVVVLFGISWIAGIAGTIALFLQNTSLQTATTVMSLVLPSDGLWRAASYALEPAMLAAASRVNGGNPFVASAPPTAAYLLWCILWFATVVACAIASFQTRDI